ncbi:hypothetical protein BDV96DRAFT_507952 [Lophiotrema nucula]|uniref:gamma-glutamylcyclotransferase n=1 Tax=Lophiotrema nucula TaxID=690887 RepID=A0A6A5YHF4_9PLEO|nr:hypothetical protein BDV96DRAFT_507952 [Lophiotrema nucula]
MSTSKNVWYFAYGSNMSSTTFREGRGIDPLQSIAVKVPGWRLVFDIFGMPYREPAFASIAPIPVRTPLEPLLMHEEQVHGIAYLVTHEQYIHIIASEGGDIEYNQIELPAVAIHGNTDDVLTVKTLVTAFACTPTRLPSLRYKEIMFQGGQEAALPNYYQRYLDNLPHFEPPKSAHRRIGAALFLSFWTPLMMFAEALTKATANSDGNGNVPKVTKLIVRFILVVMWWYHDHVHASIWGRGDGLQISSLRDFDLYDSMGEKFPLNSTFQQRETEPIEKQWEPETATISLV